MACQSDIDQLAINTIRMPAIDGVQKANSGHPGTPMDAAPTAYVLWQRFLRYDPADPHWLNRDRFVLSSGHASMLLYSLIHLTRVKAANPSYERLDRDAVTLEDIKNFRQAGSRCPGIRNMAGPPGSKQRLGRSVKAWRLALGWRSPVNGCAQAITGQATISSTSMSMCYAATAT
jgi:transketolase N-terminal domain/subunit